MSVLYANPEAQEPRLREVQTSHFLWSFRDRVSVETLEQLLNTHFNANQHETCALLREFVRHEHLLRVTVSDFRSHDVTLVFADECDEIKVDVSLDYYSPQSGAVSSEREHVPEVTWSLLVQSARDKEQFIKLLSQQWQELHGRELSVQVSA